MQSQQTQAVIEYLPRNIAEILIGDIRRTMSAPPSDRTDEDSFIESGAFRAEQFCRRVVGAEYGCQTSIEWSMQYFDDLIEEARSMMQQELEHRAELSIQNRNQIEQAQIDGKCANPRFQLFLDTLEDPKNVTPLNALYMGWIGRRLSEYQKTTKSMSFDEFLHDFVERNRSQRSRASMNRSAMIISVH